VFLNKAKKLLVITLVPFWACALTASEQEIWEQLDLSAAGINGTTVYYEKSLEHELPFFENKCRQFLAEKENIDRIRTEKKQIIADINKTLGAPETDVEKQEKDLAALMGAFDFERATFYIILRDTAKFYLSEGGTLPNFTYNKTDNTATYHPEYITTSDEGPIKHFEFVFLVAWEQTYERDISMIFQMLQRAMGGGSLGVAVHEITESTLLNRVKPTDQYWRWFSDGFANAITIRILKKYAGVEIADRFADAYYIGDYKGLEKEINLRYWMGLNFCVKTPLEYEDRLQQARYAYATQEAIRLIDKHGIDCLRRIIDKILTKETRTAADILQAIDEIAGEDMQGRFDRYQTFETRRDGLAKYGRLYSAAFEKRDYEKMLIALLRTLELQENPLSPNGLRCYKDIAVLLFKLGHEQAADQAMHNCVELFRNTGSPMARDAALEMFVLYAFNCGNALKAQDIAEELLKSKPGHVPALTVQMVVHAEAGRMPQAKEIAQKVIELDKDPQSAYYKTAAQILESEPQQQDSDQIP
jgi:hypothetical protein